MQGVCIDGVPRNEAWRVSWVAWYLCVVHVSLYVYVTLTGGSHDSERSAKMRSSLYLVLCFVSHHIWAQEEKKAG